MLVAQALLLHLVSESPLRQFIGVGGGAFAHASPSNEHLRLQHKLVFPRLALHVIHGVGVLYVRIETKNHEHSIQTAEKASFKVTRHVSKWRVVPNFIKPQRPRELHEGAPFTVSFLFRRVLRG